ncbi:threonine--tRNA ligase [Patescibacteria group bacterium]|nr:threonine--tRNA ligase [Patescibacteria group bacterium]
MKIETIRHSLAHIMALAVQELYPGVKFGIGPAIENGFYYDFDFPGELTPISKDDLPKIEKKMRDLIKQDIKFEKEIISKTEAKKLFKAQPYKLELIEELPEKTVSIYKSGDFVDLCRGLHVKSTRELPTDSFKLTKIAGAYWRGSEKNPMLTRIYGVGFKTKKELANYFKIMEETEKRDHRKLGRKLELFFLHETAPGMPYWLPKGVVIYNELINFWREEHKKRGYQEIVTPLLNKKELYETSGHWEHYREEMFLIKAEQETYGIKAMNCPNAMIVYGRKPRSYKELPLRFGDTDTIHRFERSGTLFGLFRVRAFRQDDAHIFLTEQQIKNEYKNIFEIVERFYSIFNLEYSFRLGTRPEKSMGEIKLWNKAERALKEVLEESGKKYTILEGDGAFYGPKIDILMKDSIGREWQMGSIQLDFQIPRRFNLKYADAKGKKKIPVVIHRVIYGSLERFIGILLEHYGGALPLWLSPEQVWIIPVGSSHRKYAEEIAEKLRNEGLRVEAKTEAETVSKKIREGEIQKIPYLLVVGDKEMKKKNVRVRERGKGDIGEIKLTKFLEKAKMEIEKKK